MFLIAIDDRRDRFMSADLNRRTFIAFVGGTATMTWPFVSRAQPTKPVIGWLNGGTSEGFAYLAVEFRKGLEETGYVEGQNLAIEYRYADGENNRLLGLAENLVRLQVNIIAAGGTAAAFAAKAATTTIPIVFSTASDPVETGLVVSLNRPGGNATGASNFTAVLALKQFELLHELIPNASLIGVLVNPADPYLTSTITRDVQEAGRVLGQQVHIVNASTEAEINQSFQTLAKLRVGATIVGADAFLMARREQIIALAARYGIPTMCFAREFALAGGLIAYGASVMNSYHQIGLYAGKILDGARPADLPVIQPAKFEMVINLKTAKALGLSVPLTLQVSADEVIE
jgi:putative tryptophan/tyrosine transport system substrate-binding protein